jgi:hypothetical protein
MAARPSFSSQSADEVSTTSTSYQNKANPLTFTGVSGTKYLILATARIRFTSSNSPTSGDVSLRESTTVRDERKHGNNSTAEAHQVLLSYIYTGTGSSVTFAVSFKRTGSTGTCYCSRVRIIAIALDSNDADASGSGSAANDSYEDDLTLTVNPPSSGDYLILAMAAVYASSTSAPYCGIKLHDGTNVWGEVNGTNGVKHKETSDRRHWAACAKVTLSSSTTFRIAIRRIGSSSGTVYFANGRIIALRLADLDGHAFAEQRSPQSNANSTWTVDAVTLTHTPPAHFGVIIANTNVRTSTDSNTWNARAIFPSDTAAEAIGYSRASPGMWFTHSDLWFGTPQATEQTHEVEIRAGSGPAESDEATIVWLELGTASQTYSDSVSLGGDAAATPAAAHRLAEPVASSVDAVAGLSGVHLQRSALSLLADASKAAVSMQRLLSGVAALADSGASLSALQRMRDALLASADAAAGVAAAIDMASSTIESAQGAAAAAAAQRVVAQVPSGAVSDVVHAAAMRASAPYAAGADASIASGNLARMMAAAPLSGDGGAAASSSLRMPVAVASTADATATASGRLVAHVLESEAAGALASAVASWRASAGLVEGASAGVAHASRHVAPSMVGDLAASATASPSGIATQRSLVQVAVDHASTALAAAQRASVSLPVVADAMLSAASALMAATTTISSAAADLGASSGHAMRSQFAPAALAASAASGTVRMPSGVDAACSAAADAAALMVLRSALILGGVSSAVPDARNALRSTLETAAAVAVASLTARHVLACAMQAPVTADVPFIARAMLAAASGLAAQASDAHVSRHAAGADAVLGAASHVDGAARTNMQQALPAAADVAAHGSAGMRLQGQLAISSATFVQDDAAMRGLVSAALLCAAAVAPGAGVRMLSAVAADAAASAVPSALSTMRETVGLSPACVTSIVTAHLAMAAIALSDDASLLADARRAVLDALSIDVQAGSAWASAHRMTTAIGASGSSADAVAAQLRAVATSESQAAVGHAASALAAFRSMLDVAAASAVSSIGGAAHTVDASFGASGAVADVATQIARSVLAAAVDVASVIGAMERMRSAALLEAEVGGLHGAHLRALDGAQISAAGLLASMGILRAGCAVAVPGHAALGESTMVSMLCAIGAAAGGAISPSALAALPVTTGLAVDALSGTVDRLLGIGAVGLDGAAILGNDAAARMAVLVAPSADAFVHPAVSAVLHSGFGLDVDAGHLLASHHRMRVDVVVHAESAASIHSSSRTVTALVLGSDAGIVDASAHRLRSGVALDLEATLAHERRVRAHMDVTIGGVSSAGVDANHRYVAALVAGAVAALDAIYYLPVSRGLVIEIVVTHHGPLVGQRPPTSPDALGSDERPHTLTGQMRVYEIVG